MPKLHILDIPGDINNESSDLGRFSKAMKETVGWQPGDKMYPMYAPRLNFPSVEFIYGEGYFIETPFGREKNDLFLAQLVTQKRLETFESLLQANDVRYARNSRFFELCCPKVTDDVQSLFLYNYVINDPHFGRMPEMLLFLSLPVHLFRVEAKAYIRDFLPQDEILQRTLIEDDIDLAQNPDESYSGSLPDYKMFPNAEAAQAHIDQHILSYLKSCVGERFGERYIGAFLSGDPKYRHPPELTDSKCKDGNGIVEVCMVPPRILKVFSDGHAVVSESSGLPLENLFGSKNPLKTYSISACENCYSGLRNRLRGRTLQELEDDREKAGTGEPFKYELFGEVAQRIGYTFNPDRVRIRCQKEAVPVYGIRP